MPGWNSPEEITYTYNGKTYTSYLSNYWSDYKGSDADGDGIGDIPYSIDSGADSYPLVEPFENYKVGPPLNRPPVADAGPDQTVYVASPATTAMVTLDGSGSYDPNGDPLVTPGLGMAILSVV